MGLQKVNGGGWQDFTTPEKRTTDLSMYVPYPFKRRALMRVPAEWQKSPVLHSTLVPYNVPVTVVVLYLYLYFQPFPKRRDPFNFPSVIFIFADASSNNFSRHARYDPPFRGRAFLCAYIYVLYRRICCI